MNKKLVKIFVSLLAMTIPVATLSITLTETLPATNVLKVTTQPTNPKTSYVAADYEFTSASWNDNGVATAFNNRFASIVANTPSEAKNLEKTLVVPPAWAASGYTNPAISIHGDDTLGTIRISYDYQHDTGTIKLPVNTNEVFRHTYTGFNILSDFNWTFNTSNVDFKQLPSLEAATSISKSAPTGVSLDNATKMSTYGTPEYAVTANDNTGELFIKATFPNAPSLVKTKSMTLPGFYTDTYYNVDWITKQSLTFFDTQVPNLVKSTDIINLITNKAIILGAGLQKITPTVKFPLIDPTQGRLEVELTFTDPILPKGKIVVNHIYDNLYNIADYQGVTIDQTKIDKNQFPSVVKATDSDLLTAFIPTAAIVAVNQVYGGTAPYLPVLTISSVDDLQGTLIVTGNYPALAKINIAVPFSFKITGYKNKAFNFIALSSKQTKEIPSEIDRDFKPNESENFIDKTITKQIYLDFVYSKTNPDGAKAIISNLDDKNGTIKISYDFTNAKDSNGRFFPFQTQYPTWSIVYQVTPVKDVIINNPPKKNKNADYSISNDDVNKNNAGNYVIVDQRLINAGYTVSYETEKSSDGTVDITVVYTKGSDVFKSKPIEIDGFNTNKSSWIETYWWIFLIISCAVALVIFFILFAFRKKRKDEIIKARIRDQKKV